MNGNMMKSLLISILTAIVILALFSHSGSALKCYQCDGGISPCKTNVTCRDDTDSCIFLTLSGVRNVSGCWKISNCNEDFIEKKYRNENFRYMCCQKDFCNSSPITVGSRMVLGVSVLIVIQMLF
ncbi:CD59 glycoprotein-like [Rhineura floridana]|uniref:CD59 glycoprotein-like n=1 Tax=Rhineura floridana TaxID=261503 RepID=UPI002AC83840|nr:CD59 glycoprotein-like [Rhineura floridana]XP_061469133.1 CD59 glycoprotein-like [Rhineura floridana]